MSLFSGRIMRNNLQQVKTEFHFDPYHTLKFQVTVFVLLYVCNHPVY